MSVVKKLIAFSKWFSKSDYKEIIFSAFFAIIANFVALIAFLTSLKAK